MPRSNHATTHRLASRKAEPLSTIDAEHRKATADAAAANAIRPRCEKLAALHEQLNDCRALRNIGSAEDQAAALRAAAALYRKAGIAKHWPTVFPKAETGGRVAAELATLAVADEWKSLRGAIDKVAGTRSWTSTLMAMLDGNKAMIALFCDLHESNAEAEGDYADDLPFYGMLRSRARMRRQRAATDKANTEERRLTSIRGAEPKAAFPLSNAPSGVLIDWSTSATLKVWRRIFDKGKNTIKAFLMSGAVIYRQLDNRSWQVARQHVPAKYHVKFFGEQRPVTPPLSL